MKGSILLILFLLNIQFSAWSQQIGHRKPGDHEIPVYRDTILNHQGGSYILMNDIYASRSAFFLAKDITLDLNGFTIHYASDHYGSIFNSGFERGIEGWDVRHAPGAKILNAADTHVFLGKKILSLKAGDKIKSSFVYLPIGNRSYFALCGITGKYWREMNKYPQDEMRISIYVEDEYGNKINCVTQYRDSSVTGCPAVNKSPRLGGGYIYAHLHHLRAGKYKLTIVAETDCLIDEIDIKPAMDIGISIAENSVPYADYDFVTADVSPPGYPAFYDYSDPSTKKLWPGIPVTVDEGVVVIKNGKIISGEHTVMSKAIFSNANKVKIILDHVSFKTQGINAVAVDIKQGTITNCQFYNEVPFVIQRHSSQLTVNLRGELPSEVSYCKFTGGQGCLMFSADQTRIHHNYFANRQTTTNRYTIIGSGDGSSIFENKIEPIIGSGIWASGHIQVFNNQIKISTSPPTCEYGREEYSTAAIRMADYRSNRGEKFYGNKIFNNKIDIRINDYPPKEYIPMAWAIYYSTSGGNNYVFSNDIHLFKTNVHSKAMGAAFYIVGDSGNGGEFYDNRITSNITPIWVASFYGSAENSILRNNHIKAYPGSAFKTVKMGWIGTRPGETSIAKNIQFKSNTVANGLFTIEATNQDHSYTVSWTLETTVKNKSGLAVPDVPYQILNHNGEEITHGMTHQDGKFSQELVEYYVQDHQIKYESPYTIILPHQVKKIELNQNQKLSLIVQ